MTPADGYGYSTNSVIPEGAAGEGRRLGSRGGTGNKGKREGRREVRGGDWNAED